VAIPGYPDEAVGAPTDSSFVGVAGSDLKSAPLSE
jgi:hypothetical protein